MGDCQTNQWKTRHRHSASFAASLFNCHYYLLQVGFIGANPWPCPKVANVLTCLDPLILKNLDLLFDLACDQSSCSNPIGCQQGSCFLFVLSYAHSEH